MKPSMRNLLCAFCLVCTASLTATALALAQPAPEFKLGFKILADQIPDVAGTPLENEHWGANGDSLQLTSTGLMVWRKADNWTAFTNGSVTWINGPHGVQSRYNHQRFEWEQDTPATPPPAAPKVSPGLILYQANWSEGMDGWQAVGGWQVVNGMLVNDGSAQGVTLHAPYQPEGVSNYAVEAEIQIVSIPQRKAFGLLVRDGYLGGINWWSYKNVRHPFIGTATETLAQNDYEPGNSWHKYRIEAYGNRLKLLIDGIVVLEATDNRYLSPGRVGLWNNSLQLNVRSFKVIAL